MGATKMRNAKVASHFVFRYHGTVAV